MISALEEFFFLKVHIHIYITPKYHILDDLIVLEKKIYISVLKGCMFHIHINCISLISHIFNS